MIPPHRRAFLREIIGSRRRNQPMTASIGIFYGSTTGTTERIAQDIASALGAERIGGPHDVAKVTPDDFRRYEVLLLGVPTWNIGDVQDDWAALLPELEGLDLTGK